MKCSSVDSQKVFAMTTKVTATGKRCDIEQGITK